MGNGEGKDRISMEGKRVGMLKEYEEGGGEPVSGGGTG